MTHRARLLACTALLALTTRAAAYGGAREILRPIGTIALPDVKGRIDHLAATPDGGRLFVAALGSNLVAEIDTRRRQVVGAIHGINEPQGLVYLAASGTLVVAAGGEGTVRFYDRNLRLMGKTEALVDADNVRSDPARGLVYVGYGAGGLAIIEPKRATKVGDIPLDGHPESFQLDSRSGRIFVNVPAAGATEVIDPGRRAVVTRWKLKACGGNFPLALDAVNERLFVGCRAPARLLVLNAASGEAVANLRACGDADDLFYDSASRAIYLSGGAGCVSIFRQLDADHYAESSTIASPPGARTSLFVPGTHNLYVAAPRHGARSAEILIFTAASSP